MFKQRLRGDNASQQTSMQSHTQLGKMSQVSKHGNDALDKSKSRAVSAKSVSGAAGVRNRAQTKQLLKYQPEDKGVQVSKHETNLSFILRKRLEGIEVEMNDFNCLIQEFAYAVDTEMQNFTANMGRLQKNLNRVHMMKVEDDGGPAGQNKDDKK